MLPRDLKIGLEADRLADIRRECVRLKRKDFPNAGAVLLRVFFELTVLEHLRATGELDGLVRELERRNGGKLRHPTPEMRHLVPAIIRIAKAHLPAADARKVEKAVTYHPTAPFTLSDLHSFVHTTDLPSERDIHQFWLRVEPLVRFMLSGSAAASAS